MSAPTDQQAWNEAHERLMRYLETFALGDNSQISRLALTLLDEARARHATDPSIHPTTVTMQGTQKRLAEWLATNLEEQDQNPSQLLANGNVALLLSCMPQQSPGAFLAAPLSDDLKSSLRKTLVATGPDLNISSMTPRHLDYGPMLDLARQTWHRWDAKAIATAMLFWVAVYFMAYWFLAEYL